MTIMEPEEVNVKARAPIMDRFVTIFGGAIAVSGIRISTPVKMTSATPKVTIRPIITASDHAYVEPAHWKARMRQVMDGTKKRRPSGSRCLIWLRRDPLVFFGPSALKKKKVVTSVIAPIGRLM